MKDLGGFSVGLGETDQDIRNGIYGGSVLIILVASLILRDEVFAALFSCFECHGISDSMISRNKGGTG